MGVACESASQGVDTPAPKPAALFYTKRMTSDDVARRDARLTEAVRRHHMTTRQILEFSKTWDHPYNNIKEADRRITDLKLRRFLFLKEDQGAHERGVKAAFIKIVADLHAAGFIVYDVHFEHTVKAAGVRCDCHFRAKARGNHWPDYLFKLEYEGENKLIRIVNKMLKYQEYRHEHDIPFRVLFVVDKGHILKHVHQKAGEIMERDKSTIFLFTQAKDLHTPANYATGKLWAPHPKNGVTPLVSLMPTL